MADGLSLVPRIDVVGRLPGITLCGTTSGGVPSAAISSAVLAERQHLGLREEVAHQQVVHAALAVGRGQVVGGLGETR